MYLSIKRPNLLHYEIAEAMRQAIISGQFTAGERLIEADLAERLGVSRAPLREALRQLEDEGLVVGAPHRGVSVVNLTQDDFREVYSLRQALEELAVSLLVNSITETEIAALRRLVVEMDAAARHGDAASLVDLELRCHETIVKFSRHRRLYAAWKRMEGQLRLFFAAADPLFEEHDLTARHAKLVDAVASGNRDIALDAIRDHIGHAAELIIAQAEIEESKDAS